MVPHRLFIYRIRKVQLSLDNLDILFYEQKTIVDFYVNGDTLQPGLEFRIKKMCNASDAQKRQQMELNYSLSKHWMGNKITSIKDYWKVIQLK